MEREVDYLPLSRILPAQEVSGLLTSFKNPAGNVFTKPLDTDSIENFSYIMGRQYSSAEIQQKNRLSFQKCNSDCDYTAFNMGGGECCIIALLHLLQRMPRGGLLIIEEIEAGLHPQAQKRLAEVLLNVCLSKQLQIICTTHSQVFLDALPRPARLILKKSGSDHSVIEAPSTRYAMYEMTGEIHPELVVYCEDQFARILISEALSSDARKRVKIQDVGCNSRVIEQGVAHIRSGFEMRSLCVLDGDCTDNDVSSWIRSARGERNHIEPEYLILPGDVPPEKWVVEQLQEPEYTNTFVTQFNCTYAEAVDHIQALSVQIEHHKLGYILHQRTNIEASDCEKRVARAISSLHPELDPLRELILLLLD